MTNEEMHETNDHDLLDHHFTADMAQQLLDITGLDYDELTETELDNWLLVDVDEREEELQNNIENSVWAFNPTFLACFTKLPEEIFKALQDQCEGANDTVMALIQSNGPHHSKKQNFEAFCEEATLYDGYGHFLSPYDGEEHEIEKDGKTKYWLYRLN